MASSSMASSSKTRVIASISNNFPVAETENLQNIKWIIKPTQSKRQDWNKFILELIDTSSIGIDYNIISDITELDEEALSEILDGNPCTSGHPRRIKQIKDFIHNVNVGDKIIVGKGAYKSLYCATIESEPYFDSDTILTCKIRRKLTDIKKLPQGFTRKCSLQTIVKY